MNDTELAGFLSSNILPMEHRREMALDALHSSDAAFHARAACWLAYRAIENEKPGEMIGPLETALQLNSCDKSPFLSYRWRASLLMALAYCQLYSEQDPTAAVYALSQEPDLVSKNPTAIVNVCRACALFCALHRNDEPRLSRYVHEICADRFQMGVSLLTLHRCATCIGEEMLCAARAVFISILIQNNATASTIAPIEKSQPFNRALTLAYLTGS